VDGMRQDVDAACREPASRRCRPVLLACTLLALALAGSWAAGHYRVQIEAGHAQLFDAMIAAALLAYVLAMALPFVPGIEIGLALMLVLGDEGIVLVYLATQVALLISFLVGRWVPTRCITAAFRWLHMERAGRLVEAMGAIPGAERAARLARRSPLRWLAALARHRGLVLATALNLPGNAVIGGAGGIGLIAGMSRAYTLPRYLLLIGAATTPVPLVLLLQGTP